MGVYLPYDTIHTILANTLPVDTESMNIVDEAWELSLLASVLYLVCLKDGYSSSGGPLKKGDWNRGKHNLTSPQLYI